MGILLYMPAIALLVGAFVDDTVLAQVSPAVLFAVDADHACMSDDCSDREAIIFVHGIYGSRETFRNATTNFDWPSQFPTTVAGRRIDVFVLDYRTVLLGWTRESQADFRQIDEAVFAAMKPLRTRNYRSIGIIAHSLGGNVASSYVHAVKTALSHPARAQHAFVITLATPVLGSQVADLGSMLKSVLGMSDLFLNSLKEDNLFLSMLQSYRIREGPKGEAYRCRPVHLHGAFEQQRMGPFLIVSESSAVDEVRSIAVPPIRGFERDYSGIAKPSGPTDEVFQWVLTIVNAEYLRLAIWEQAHQDFPPERRLCELIPRFPE
jgi:pimeloyl-ACP methyl ester carboxylesterase